MIILPVDPVYGSVDVISKYVQSQIVINSTFSASEDSS